MIRAILLAAILAGPAVAQTDAETIDKLADQYGDFAPAVEEKPLDELLSDMEAETADTAAPAPEKGDATDAAQPGAAQAPVALAPAEIPAGWTRHEVFGLTFAVPDDWEVMRESDDTYALAAPGFTPQEQKGFGLSILLVDAHDFVEDFLEDPTFAGLLEADKRPLLPVATGIGFDRFVGLPEQTGENFAIDGATSRYRHLEDGHLLVNFIAFDPALLSEKADIIDRIYATMRLADPEAFKAQTTLAGRGGGAPSAPVTTLGGLVTIRPPEGWGLTPGEDKVDLRTERVFSAAITLRRGAAARDALSFDGLFQGEPDESAGRILGQPARVFSGLAGYVGMQFGARIERGEVRVYVLEQCLPDGSPVMIETAAAPGWLAKNDLQPLLDGIRADWREGMQPCHPAVTARAEWAMDGLFAFVLPEGFESARSRSSFWIRTKTGPYAALSVGTGPDSFPSDFQLAASNSLGNGFIAPPETRRVEIMGEPATLFVGRSRAGEGSRVLHVALLDRCLPDDGPVMVKLQVDDEWLAANDGFDKLLTRSWLVLPEDAKPCDASLIETALEVSGANQASAVSQEDDTTSPPAPPAFEHPSDSQSAGTATETADGTPPGWVRHAKGGLSVAVPETWTRQQDAGRMVIANPQANVAVLITAMPSDWSKRFLTDETLRAAVTASDIRPVELAPGVVFLSFVLEPNLSDDQSYMYWLLSRSSFPEQGHPVVVAKAKDAESFAANLPLMRDILATTRLVDPADFTARGTPVGPEWPLPERQSAAPTAPRNDSADARSPVFDGDMSGWTVTAAQFEVGAAEITAKPAGDDATSYYIAPGSVLGDWSGFRALRLDKKSSGGRYFAEGYGAEGDIVLEGPGGRAIYSLPEDHSGKWRSFEVPLDGSGWTLSQGARDIAEVLHDVTSLHIRAEYGVGADQSGLRNVRLISDERATAPEGASGDGAWRPVGDPVTGGLESKVAVENGPTKPTAFRLEGRAQIDRVTTYHWNNGHGAVPGTIALRDEDGRLYGPWSARGAEGQGGVANAYWHAEPGIVLPAGKYTIVDSDAGTWATNDDVGKRGIFTIEVRKVIQRDALARRDKAQTEVETGQSDAAQGSDEAIFWQSISGSKDPADFEAYLRTYPEGVFAPLARNRLKRLGQQAVPVPSSSPAAYYMPARGTTERSALMDAARVPVERELGQEVLFVVSRLRSDGNWAYLAATPIQPDGQPLDWLRTPMADTWRADMMSDLILVVLRRGGSGWQAVEHAIGPTDVAWLDWIDKYGWPRALFAD